MSIEETCYLVCDRCGRRTDWTNDEQHHAQGWQRTRSLTWSVCGDGADLCPACARLWGDLPDAGRQR